MECAARVDLTREDVTRVVLEQGGCIAWNGRLNHSMLDDIVNAVTLPLGLDTNRWSVASIMSKKYSAGSTHVVIDIPIGPTAKVRSTAAANALESMLCTVGTAIGLSVRILRTDGTQPVGRGIGPALEARDVLRVLRCQADAPGDLRERSLDLAGVVLEIGGAAAAGAGRVLAENALDSGRALSKFEAICAAQGGMREPAIAPLMHVVGATRRGRISGIDNRRLARLAKLAGAPRAASAGIELHARLGASVQRNDPLITIHAETPGELDYARGYLAANPQVIVLEEL
jgi:thymidine phosphorylase